MSQIIKIKRTTGDGKPTTVEAGELFYAYDTASNNGTYSRKLAIGDPSTNTDSPKIVGGEYFTEMLDHTKGTVVANSALIVDANSKLNILNVDNITINGNSITSTDINGDITITPNALGSIILDGQSWPQANGNADEYLTTDGNGTLSWAAVPSGSFTIQDNQALPNTDTFTTGNTLTFEGGTNIETTVSNDNIKIDYTGTTAAIYVNNGLPTLEGTITAAEVRTLLSVDPAGTDNSTDVTIASGSKDYITLSGQELTVGSIDLTDDVTGTLPVANGGTGLNTIAANRIVYSSGVDTLATSAITSFGRSLIDDADAATARTTLGVDAAGTDNSTDVTLAGAYDYLTLSGQQITLNQIDLTTDVTGALPNGGLEFDSITIGTTSIELGASTTTLAGLTQVDVDNLRISGNTISSTDTNGTIALNPNGTGVVSVGSSRITGVADPVDANDAANKAYVDSVAEGLHVHAQVHAIVVDSLASITGGSVTYNNGTDGVGATLTLGTALDLSTDLDGHPVSIGERIIVAGESNAAHNGIYIVTSTTVLTRADDFDTPTEMAGGDFVFVTHGTTYADTGWVLSEPVATVGTDSVSFVQFSGAGAYEAGSGLTRTGTTFSVNVANGIEISSNNVQLASTVAGDGLTYTNGVVAVGGTANRISVSADAIDIASTYVGQTSITTLGTITTGTWNGTAIGTTRGGTGLVSYATGDILYASAANTLSKLTKPSTNDSFLVMSAAGVPSWTNVMDGGTY